MPLHIWNQPREGSAWRAGLMFNVRLLRRFTSCLSFYSILNELNDYAGQREVVAEEMAHKVYGELMRYSQDLKAERKLVSTPTSSDSALEPHFQEKQSLLSFVDRTKTESPISWFWKNSTLLMFCGTNMSCGGVASLSWSE